MFDALLRFRNSLAPDVRAGLRLIYRAGFGAIAVWLLLAFSVVVLVASEFSARQVATVALDVGLSFLRIVLPVIVVLLVQELISREFERRLHLASLTYPRPRSYWLLGRLIAVALVVFGLLVILAIWLAVLVQYVAGSYAQASPPSLGLPYLLTLTFATADLLVVLGIAALLAVVTTTPSVVLIGTLGFVLIARSYTPILQILEGADYLVDKFADPRLYRESLSLLNVVLPDLGAMDIRMVSLYAKLDFLPEDWGLLLASAVAYSVALISLAVWRLNARALN